MVAHDYDAVRCDAMRCCSVVYLVGICCVLCVALCALRCVALRCDVM